MHAFYTFIRENVGLLLFGFTLTFFSGFGQTFLISLYVPEIGAVFNLNNTELSSLYAMGTLGSALLLTWVGRYVDYWPLTRFTIIVLIGLSAALLVLSIAPHPLVVLLGFFGLRLFGQGLMPHTSVSTMARAFVLDRGKAISLATIGHPAGEAILPVVVAFFIAWIGWRYSLQLSAAIVVVLVIPLVFWLLRQQSDTIKYPGRMTAGRNGISSNKPFNPLHLLRTKAFWIIIPAVFLIAFLNTAILFFQVQLGESRGWERSWVAGSLVALAIAGAVSMLLSGPLVDKFTARRTFPFILVPYLGGLSVLLFYHAPLSYPITLFLLGFSNGAGSTIKNALLAEVYGTNVIGSVRSLFTTFIVFSTALGPITFGLLLDMGLNFDAIILLSAVVVGLAMVWSFRIWRVE